MDARIMVFPATPMERSRPSATGSMAWGGHKATHDPAHRPVDCFILADIRQDVWFHVSPPRNNDIGRSIKHFLMSGKTPA